MLTETENKGEPIFPSKRKFDPLPVSEDKEVENQPNKSQKLPSLTHGDTAALKEEKFTPSVDSESNFSTAEEKSIVEAVPGKNENGVVDEQQQQEDDSDFEDEEENNEKDRTPSSSSSQQTIISERIEALEHGVEALQAKVMDLENVASDKMDSIHGLLQIVNAKVDQIFYLNALNFFTTGTIPPPGNDK